ncbi:MAG: DUF3887 domain-containing protein [Phycisphaerae bacterium]|nr:DUF3887 domain-containing protein [Phycisphaerae bacterium]
MRRALIFGIGVIGLTSLWGCGDQDSEPRYNRNLGEKAGELMPVGVAPADSRILDNQEGIKEQDFTAPAAQAAPGAARGQEGKPDAGGRGDRRGRTPAEAPEPGKKGAPEAPKVGSLADLAKKAEAPAAASPLIAHAQGLVKKLAAGQLDEVVKDFNPEMKAQMPVEAIKAAWQAMTTQLGEFKGTDAGKVEPLEQLSLVTLPTRFAKGTLDARVVYDKQNKVAGLHFLPPGTPLPKMPPAGATPPPAPTGKAPAGKEPASPTGAKGATKTNFDSVALSMSAPWTAWKPPAAEGLVAAFTQKGVADVAVWSMPIPKEVKPEMRNSPIGRQMLSAMLKQEAKKQFSAIDKFKPLNKTAVLDGAEAIEVSCSLKKGPIAGTQAEGEGVCFGLTGKTKAFLVTYRIPVGSKKADEVRKAVIAAVKVK